MKKKSLFKLWQIARIVLIILDIVLGNNGVFLERPEQNNLLDQTINNNKKIFSPKTTDK